MPHRVAGRKLGRKSSHRLSMLSNLAVAVVRYERVKTTEAKAKEVRGLVDGMITTAKRGDLAARRALAAQMPHEPLIVDKLMGELAEKYADRASGYTRITKIGERLGDAAPIVQIELV
jgi:large subunit ribosomal protein L17